MVFLSKYGAWPVAFAIGAFIMDRNAADDGLEKLKERIEALKDKAKSNTDLLTRLTAKVAKLADIPNSKWAEHKDVGGGIEMLPIPMTTFDVGHVVEFNFGADLAAKPFIYPLAKCQSQSDRWLFREDNDAEEDAEGFWMCLKN